MLKKITLFSLAAAIYLYGGIAWAFTGTVNEDNINVRADANTNSPVICRLTKNQPVEVILERYDWYKIRLPKQATVFVKSSLLEPIDEKTAKAKGDNINIRLKPDQASAILGTLKENEVVAVLGESAGWARIEPTANTLGWVHKRFIDPREQAAAPAVEKKTEGAGGEDIVIVGVVQPYGKVINRIATHKLIASDYSTYLLKGNRDSLNPLVYHKVRVSGRVSGAAKEKYPVIEIAKLEALD